MKNFFLTLTIVLSMTALFLAATAMKYPQDQKKDTPPVVTPPDTAQISAMVNKLVQALGEKVDSPASVAFQNIQFFKRMPAGRMLGMMRSWTRNLGVGCEHCHTVDQWDKDDKAPKLTARAMEKFEDDVNDLVHNIKSITNERAHVNCWTCHRGSAKPETNPFGRERRQ